MLTDDEWYKVRYAITYARDVAFLTVGDKNHKAVKGWEKLLERVDEERCQEGLTGGNA